MKSTLALCLTAVLLLPLGGLAQEADLSAPQGVSISETPPADATAPPTAIENPAEAASPADVETPSETEMAAEQAADGQAAPAAPTEAGASEVSVEKAENVEDVIPSVDPATVEPIDDKNYRLLGEYVGDVTVPGGETQRLGVQVRPLGDDRFDARQFIGGLPGQEGTSQQSQSLLGYRSGDVLVLSGAAWAVFVDHEKCRIIDVNGTLLGELPRLERTSPSLGAAAPEGAIVLFDGTNIDQFTSGKMTDDGWLMPGADIIPMFQDFDMHVEFKVPYLPNNTGQSRGNSGCYLLSRYELQILDSFAETPTFNGCSSLYRQVPPDVNMSFPALQWQTYDISFTAPRWASDGSKLRHARITVWHNGVKTHDNREIVDKTGAGKIEEPSLLPIRLQDHQDPVRFRNIWIVDRGLTPAVGFPVVPAE